MKRILLLSLFVITAALGVTPTAKKSHDPTPRIQAATKAAVQAYLQSSSTFVTGNNTRPTSVVVKIESTKPRPGWAGQYTTSGQVTFKLKKADDSRRFDVITSGTEAGAIQIVEISLR